MDRRGPFQRGDPVLLRQGCGRQSYPTADQADYALVLRLALENGEPVPDLLARLDKAQEYLAEYPEARLILTGGNADESGRSEADVMRDILTERVVPEDKLILEDRSTTTVENFRNVAEMISRRNPLS